MPYLVYALDHDGMNNKREEIRNEHSNYGNKIIALLYLQLHY
jgi:hypothetical protein